MNAALRDELARLADAAPVAHVPVETWARAQRSRRRRRVAAVAAVAAAVAVVAGLVTGVPQRPGTPVAGGDGAGVPSRVWSVPERMAATGNDDQWLREEVERDLAVGRAAVAFAQWGLPVVVDAAAGGYHPLDLPGWPGNRLMLRSQPLGLAVSPDGRRLAYAWAGPATATAPVPSGVRVLDLVTGDVRTVTLRGGEGTVVDTIAWSPDSRWLVWSGDRKDSWTASSMGGSARVAGRIAPAATSSERLPAPDDESTAYAVADTGDVTVLTTGRMLRWDGRVVQRRGLDVPQVRDRGAALAPRGATMAYGSWWTGGAVAVDVASGQPVRHRLPAGVYADGAEVRPLGWIDDELVVSEVSPLDAAGQQSGDGQLVVMTRRVSTASTASTASPYRIVGHTEGGVGDTVSVAVDLMSPDRPTVERPEPDWPWSDERKAATGVLGALVLLTAGALAVRWRRRGHAA